MHWLPKSVGRGREGKFKHAGIFLHDPVYTLLIRYFNSFCFEMRYFVKLVTDNVLSRERAEIDSC